MKKLYKGALMLSVMALPALAFAADVRDAQGLIRTFTEILRLIVPVIFALAFLYFFWGVVEYVTKAGEEKKEATERIVGGLIALFVMFSVYGLITVIKGTFGTTDTQITRPEI